jgi:hypothetical protein
MPQPLKLLLLTITDTHTYANLANLPLKLAVYYALIMFTLISLAYAAYFTLVTIPPVLSQTKTALQLISDQLPDNLILTISEGTLTVSGITEPYVLDQILTINTNATAESIKDASTLIMLTSQAISFFQDAGGEAVRIVKWSEVSPDTTITGQTIKQEAALTLTTINRLEPFRLPLIAGTVFIALLLLRLSFLLIHSLMLKLVLKISGKSFPYHIVFKIGLYTLVVIEILWGITQILYQNPPGFLYSLGFYLITLIAFSAFKPRLTAKNTSP